MAGDEEIVGIRYELTVPFGEMLTGQTGIIVSGSGHLCNLDIKEGKPPVFIGAADSTTDLAKKHVRKLVLHNRFNDPVFCLQVFDPSTRIFEQTFYIPEGPVSIFPQNF